MPKRSIDEDHLWSTLQRLAPGKGVTALLVFILAMATEQWDVFAVYVADTVFMSFTILFVGIEANRTYAAVTLFFQFLFFGFGLWTLVKAVPQFFDCDIHACRGYRKDFYYAWWGVLWLSVIFNSIITGVLADLVGLSLIVQFFRPKESMHYKLT